MKNNCKNCGAPINIYNESCRYCGSSGPEEARAPDLLQEIGYKLVPENIEEADLIFGLRPRHSERPSEARKTLLYTEILMEERRREVEKHRIQQAISTIFLIIITAISLLIALFRRFFE